MRIAYVTAHLPPDFTSGATLLVERLAREAVALGHEVEVLSGAINQGLADGETRVDHPTDERDFTIRWIGTAERIEQDDDGNWDNPGATTATRQWLRDFRPDVVHIHTLQTLGVGVVEEAVATGIRTVVTMHDLWWWCARLFLVDTELRPCPLVTDVNTCACARTASWRSKRAERLRRALDGVDQILAPSSALRDVIVANGVDPDRVAVDENHVVELPMTAIDPDVPVHGRPIRFLYVGGDSPLKGADVLRRAVAALAHVAGWELDAYGLVAAEGLPTQCRAHPPFDPSKLPAILGAADALIIPSIARESFSIAAREAFAAGLAVITSDCLGPEEVVVDGINGLVVPTGDAATLAAAMQRLVEDRDLLGRLTAHARSEPPALRSAREQVNGLLDIYEGTSQRGHHETRTVAFVVGADGAIARYRVHHPREALALRSGRTPVVAHYLDPDLDLLTAGADVVVLQRVPATVRILELIDSWRAAGQLIVFDTDDLIFDPDLAAEIPAVAAMPADERAHYLDGVRRYRTTLEACDGAIVSTPAIAERIDTLTGLPTAVVANGLGLVELRLAEQARRATRRSDRVRIAYLSGSDSHQPDLDLLAGPVAAILDRHAHVDVVTIGPVEPGPELSRFGDRVAKLGFQPWQSLPALLTSVDINLAPLVLPSEFNEAKSAVKWLEASAVGVPTVASASAPFAEAIEDGTTGLLCSTPDEWVDALELLVGNAPLRARIGSAARRHAELRHGPHVTAFAYERALTTLADRRSALPRTSSWIPVAPDERAPSAPPLDAYDAVGEVGRGSLGRRVRRLVSSLLRR